MIALVDYGAGNLTSVKKALSALDYDYRVPAPAECVNAEGIIVPGVGHFAATVALEGPWRQAITAAIASGTPLLGICVGMQWLYAGSDEDADVPGLGAIAGRCALLPGDADWRLKIPHVGWNALEFQPGAERSRLLRGIESGAYVYFTHSYAGPVNADCVATATHAATFAAVVERDNVFGVQFHPEKSSDAGLQILRNFLAVCTDSAAAARGAAARGL